jgi:hypothetical protein
MKTNTSSDFGMGTGATYMSFDDQGSTIPFSSHRDLTISEQMGFRGEAGAAGTGYYNRYSGGSSRQSSNLDSYTSGNDWSSNSFF